MGGTGVLSCLCAQLGAKRVLASDDDHLALTRARSAVEAVGHENTVDVQESSIDEFRKAGNQHGGPYDLLVSGRLLADLRFSPRFVKFVAARASQLRPSGNVVPRSAGLWVCGLDFSAEIN